MAEVKVDSDVLKESVSSVKIIKNSKGVNWEIKVYNPNIEVGKKLAIKIFSDLKKEFPEEE